MGLFAEEVMGLRRLETPIRTKPNAADGTDCQGLPRYAPMTAKVCQGMLRTVPKVCFAMSPIASVPNPQSLRYPSPSFFAIVADWWMLHGVWAETLACGHISTPAVGGDDLNILQQRRFHIQTEIASGGEPTSQANLRGLPLPALLLGISKCHRLVYIMVRGW